jgi:hypothetical protein
MTELVAIRTFMKLKVFEAIPLTGSISLQNLSKATGAQDSLLGIAFYTPRIFHANFSSRTNGPYSR